MKRKTRLRWQLRTLGAITVALIAIGLMPTQTTVVRIDPPGQSPQQLDTAPLVGLGIMLPIGVAILAIVVWSREGLSGDTRNPIKGPRSESLIDRRQTASGPRAAIHLMPIEMRFGLRPLLPFA
jgi:hypothetical protein